ncbi:hypothetical protein [Nocardia sp. NPDC024068]|uniref:hypothetical protein n=1 Tax=Nocardia sp. NPDC024068 TaxID=3157197 RepID=UPI0033D32DD7
MPTMSRLDAGREGGHGHSPQSVCGGGRPLGYGWPAPEAGTHTDPAGCRSSVHIQQGVVLVVEAGGVGVDDDIAVRGDNFDVGGQIRGQIHLDVDA